MGDRCFLTGAYLRMPAWYGRIWGGAFPQVSSDLATHLLLISFLRRGSGFGPRGARNR